MIEEQRAAIKKIDRNMLILNVCMTIFAFVLLITSFIRIDGMWNDDRMHAYELGVTIVNWAMAGVIVYSQIKIR